MLCDVLRHRGHTCEAVATRPEAFDMMSSFAPDVVLLEWAMRDESGRGLARRLCAQSVVGNWDIAIILLTIVVKLLTQVAVVEWSRSARTWCTSSAADARRGRARRTGRRRRVVALGADLDQARTGMCDRAQNGRGRGPNSWETVPESEQ